MKTQNLSFKVNTKRDSKSYNDNRSKDAKFEHKASVAFKLRRQRQNEEYSQDYDYAY